MTNHSSRRDFLKNSSAVLLAAQALGSHRLYAAAPMKKLNIAIIGCGGIMGTHVRGLAARKDEVTIPWLCDVDPAQIEAKAAMIPADFQSTPPKRTLLYEEVLKDPDVDACVIATPHHWHARMAIDALQAGKHVYLEKPISHVYAEGPLLAAAAKKFNRILQQGSQMRSSPVTEAAGKLLKDGIIGDIKIARAWTAETRNTIKPVPDSDPPPGVDYDRWLGPAPKRPFNPHRFHFTWRMFRDYGNGEIGDDGIHDLDMATWGLGIDTLPKQITARGGRMLLDGHVSDYPDNMNVTYEYPDGRLLIYENYPFTEYGMHGFDNGNVFYGTKGYMIFSRRGAFSTFLGPKSTPGPTEPKELRTQKGYTQHMTNFLEAIRNGVPINAPPEIAHRSCALVHLGEIAYRTTGRLDFDPQTEKFTNHPPANDLLTKPYRPPYTLPSI